jgi:virulence-associated protein VapD
MSDADTMEVLKQSHSIKQPIEKKPEQVPLPKEKIRMYAVAFDLDTELLKQTYGDPPNNAYGEIKRFLIEKGFDWQQGSVYFGTDKINAVTCVLAITEMSKALPWFAASVRDIRMLRIEEFNDLMPAIQLDA